MLQCQLCKWVWKSRKSSPRLCVNCRSRRWDASKYPIQNGRVAYRQGRTVPSHQQEYRKEQNRKKAAQRTRAWYAKNRERALSSHREYYARNTEQIRKRIEKWKQENSEDVRQYHHQAHLKRKLRLERLNDLAAPVDLKFDW
jgi:hypothetical protein